MKIGLLQADSVMAQYQDDFGNYPEMFVKLLGGARPREGITFHIYDLQQDQYPDSVDECDAYVITGSGASVYDDEGWIRKLQHFVVSLHAAKVKLVGICFGHQMVAQALGGVTTAAHNGWGVGVSTSDVLNRSTIVPSNVSEFSLVVSHKDQVTELPRDAELLAGSDFCPYAMFKVEDHILTFQGHPEFSKGYSRAVMDWREEILGPETYRKGVASLARPTDEKDVAEWIMSFIENVGSEQKLVQ